MYVLHLYIPSEFTSWGVCLLIRPPFSHQCLCSRRGWWRRSSQERWCRRSSWGWICHRSSRGRFCRRRSPRGRRQSASWWCPGHLLLSDQSDVVRLVLDIPKFISNQNWDTAAFIFLNTRHREWVGWSTDLVGKQTGKHIAWKTDNNQSDWTADVTLDLKSVPGGHVFDQTSWPAFKQRWRYELELGLRVVKVRIGTDKCNADLQIWRKILPRVEPVDPLSNNDVGAESRMWH